MSFQTAAWPLAQLKLFQNKKISKRAFLKTIPPCIHQEPAVSRFVPLLQRDRRYKELLMGISDFSGAQFVWVLGTILPRDNPHYPPVPTFREKEA